MIWAAVISFPLFDCQLNEAIVTNQLVCGDGTKTTVVWAHFWGCVVFAACVIAALFVVFATYKVLFTVPRSDDESTNAFNRSKEAEIAILNQRRFGIRPSVAATYSAVGVTDTLGVFSNPDDESDDENSDAIAATAEVSKLIFSLSLPNTTTGSTTHTDARVGAVVPASFVVGAQGVHAC